MSEYLSELKFSGGRVKFASCLPNYAVEADLKNATGVATWSFAKKTDIANLKSDVDKLDIDKLKNVPTNLSNLKSIVDKLDVDKLVAVPVDLSKLPNVVNLLLLKKMSVMLRSKILKIKCLILLT